MQVHVGDDFVNIKPMPKIYARFDFYFLCTIGVVDFAIVEVYKKIKYYTGGQSALYYNGGQSALAPIVPPDKLR